MRDYGLKNLYPNTQVLSSSQLLCYAKSPQQFYTEYEIGLAREVTDAMKWGIAFSEFYSDQKFDMAKWLTGELAMKPKDMPIVDKFKKAILCIKIAKLREHEIIVPVPSHPGWFIRVTLDGLDNYEIIENKTGLAKWDQAIVDRDPQLTLQAYARWKESGVPPSRITLNWIPRRPGGKLVYSFKTYRSVSQLKRFEVWIDAIVQNIIAKNWTKKPF